jgi:hypothetical protein
MPDAATTGSHPNFSRSFSVMGDRFESIMSSSGGITHHVLPPLDGMILFEANACMGHVLVTKRRGGERQEGGGK